MIQTVGAVSEQAVLAALRTVSDPELDESLVELGFLDRVRIEDEGCVEVVLRLPTFWCAPNFAYLMAFDAREVTLRVPGVRQVRVVLKDHMYSDEISTGISAGQPFDEVFPGQVLARMASTGCSTGVHLHFMVQDSSGAFLDPFNFLGSAPRK